MTYLPSHAENDSYFNYDSVSSENIIDSINQANKDEEIKAIVIEVDSAGGSLVGGEEISNAIKNSEKPVVALIRDRGDSSSYWAISSASRIFASRNSDVGAIGVTMSYLTNVDKNSKDGYKLEILNSGKFKDSGSANKALTSEERVLFQRDINIIYKNFMESVSKNRNIPLDKVKAFSDGSTVLGATAKEKGLVDEIGGLPEVENYLEVLIKAKPEICWE
jgi:protease-4